MPIATRITSTGTQLVNGEFDEFSGIPIVDGSLKLWLDAGQLASYPGTGTTWFDLSGNSNNLTFASTTEPQIYGIAIQGTPAIFQSNVSSSYMQSPSFSGTYSAATGFTVSHWAYATGTGIDSALLNWTFGSTSFYSKTAYSPGYRWVNGTWSGTAGASFGSTAADTSNYLNRWVNTTVVVQNGVCRVYLNGVFSASTTLTSPAGTVANPVFRVGSNYGPQRDHIGWNSNFLIYNRPLSPTEVARNYNALAPRHGLPLIVIGSPTVNANLVLHLDAANTASYPGTGTTWFDLSGRNNHATLVVPPVYSALGYFTFNGTNTYANMASTTSLTTATPTIIVACTTSAGGQTPLAKGQYGSYWNYGLHAPGLSNFYLRNNSGDTVSSNYPYSNIYGMNVFAGVWDGTYMNFYLNGILINQSTTNYSPVATNSGFLTIGCALNGATPTEFYAGNIAVVQVYNRALTATEIAENFTQYARRSVATDITRTSTRANVMYTNGFDEFTGAPVVNGNLMVWVDAGQTASFSGNTTWADLSGNGKNYTLSNGPSYNSVVGGGVINFTAASSQYANTTASLFNSTTHNKYTMSVWVYPTSAGDIVQVNGQSAPNTNYHYSAIEITSGGTIYFGQWTGALSVIATSAQSLNAWYNLVITYNGTTATAYVNGVSVGSSNISWTSPGAQTFMSLMSIDTTSMGTSSYASGSLGQFMVYNQALSAVEVAQNYNALRGRYGRSPVTATQMPVVKRELTDGTILVNSGGFDEWTGAPVVDASLLLWLDAGQTASNPGSGTTWNDISGNNIPLTVINPGAASATNGSTYFEFTPTSPTSSSTYYQITDSRVANLTTNLTLETCVYCPSYTTGDTQKVIRPVSPRTVETSSPYGFGLAPDRTGSTGGVTQDINTSSGWFVTEDPYVPRNLIDFSRWIHVTQVQDDVAKTLKTYINGQLRVTTNYTGTPNSGGGILIGRGFYAGTRNFTGRVALVKLYNRPLTEDEITTNFRAVRGRFGI